MSVDAATFSRKVNQTTALRLLVEHPHWSLADLADYFDANGPLTDALGQVTVSELVMVANGDLYRTIREQAKQLAGPEFDALVLATVRSMGPGWFATRKIRAVLGGPRCKVQYALVRLATAGKLERSGTTSATRYRACALDRSDAS